MPSSVSRISLLALLVAGQASAITQDNALSAFKQLQTWYNNNNGLWIPSTGWWNSANCLTVIADLAAVNSDVANAAKSIYPETHSKAQQYNNKMVKTMNAQYEPETFYGAAIPAHLQEYSTQASSGGFLNGYYDDEGWWAHAWIAVYDRTQQTQYLTTAEQIVADMASAQGTTPCGAGAIWWDKKKTYVNAIANELFLSATAHLANRPTTQKPASHYLSLAKSSWSWFQASGLINSRHTINDGLDKTTCKNNNGTVWSYNQGVILGGLVALSKASNSDQSYISTAKSIADAAIAALTDKNGILHDPCEPNCGGDGTQFKGVFARNLVELQKVAPEVRYKSFLQKNADAVWAQDRRGSALSVVWSGPFVAPANASTQSSALDVITGALSV